MRVLKLGLLSSIALVAFAAALSTEVNGQDPRFIGGGQGITVFEDRNFRGAAVTYQDNVSNLPSRFNNRISSVRVGRGEQWQVCDQANYRGQCVTISGEESDLGNNNWDDRISSFRRLRGGGGGGGGGWGGGQARPPSWAVGTFYSAYPSVTMTIGANGQVQSNIGGQLYYGTFTNQGIRSNDDGSVANVTRLGNGIRTYNRSNGQTIDFTRNWGGGGDGGDSGGGSGGGWEGPTSAPPNWAVGTFETERDNVRMTVNRNGQVTTRIGDNTYYGRYYYGSIYSNGEVAAVTQDRNGIRTYNRTTGVYYNWRRR